MKTFKEIMYNVRDCFILMAFFIGAAYLIGSIVMAVINVADGGSEFLPLGSIMSVIGVVLYGYAGSMGNTASYHIYISLGCTRRKYFLISMISQIIVFALGIVMMGVLFVIEEMIGFFVYGQIDVLDYLAVGSLIGSYFPVIAFFCAAYYFIVSGVVVRFGRVGVYINLTIWILACITLSSGNELISAATGGRLSAGKIFGVIMNMGNWALMGLGLAVFLVGLGIYWLLIYNKEVNI